MKKTAIDFIKKVYDVDSELHSEPQFHLADVVDLMKIYGKYIRNEALNIGDASSSLPPDVAEKILKARDAFVEKDYDEVWHWLYSIASPNYDKTEPWENLERTAGRAK